MHGAAVTAAVGFGVYASRSAERPPAKIEIQQQRAQAAVTQTTPMPDVVPEDVTVLEPLQDVRIEDSPAEMEPAPEADVVANPATDFQPALLERVLAPSPRRAVEAQKAIPTPVKTPPLVPKSVPPESAEPESQPQAFVEARRSDNQAPEYPKREQRLGREGTVVVRVFVAADGSVNKAELHKPSRYPGLNRAALRAARGWRYEPARRDGAPVASNTDVTVEFRLVDAR